MRLRHTEHIGGEQRYDAETLKKVTTLATRLQSRQQETLTAEEIEAIGAEVGLDRALVRQALDQLTALPAPQTPLGPPRRMPAIPRKKIIAAWWATGWSIPMFFANVGHAMGLHTDIRVLPLSLFLYVVPGTLLSIFLKE